jgi:hypothetical protein
MAFPQFQTHAGLSTSDSGSFWSFSYTSSATSGNIYGFRLEVQGTGASTGAIRGIRCEAQMGEEAEASLLEAGLFTAKVSEGSCVPDNVRALTGHVSIGSGLVVSGDCVCVNAHMQTRSDESVTGVHAPIYIKNEAFAGNGLKLDAAIYITEASLGANVKGYECLIDASTATMTAQSGNIVHLLTFKDSGGTGRVLYFDSDSATAVAVTTT